MWTEHSHTSHFLVFHSTHFNEAHDMAQEQDVARTSSHMSSSCGHVVCCLILYDSPFLLFSISLIFFFILLIFTCIFIFHVEWFEWNKNPPHSREWRLRHLGRKGSSQMLWVQRPRHLRHHWHIHPGVLQLQQVLKSAWLGIRWLHHRHGALFTTVHPGARRSSEP